MRVFMRVFGHKDIATTIKCIDASDDLIRNAVAMSRGHPHHIKSKARARKH